MAYAAEILARAHEQLTGPYPQLSSAELVAKFITLDNELKLLDQLQGLNVANPYISSQENVILVISENHDLSVYTYRTAPEALRALFELETQFPEADVVLVRAATSQDVRLAFKSYFSDAVEFVELVNAGVRRLMAD